MPCSRSRACVVILPAIRTIGTSEDEVDIWKEVAERGEAAIQNLLRERVSEGQRLEFKRKSSPDRPEMNTDDKKGLGESLSALSNAEGGLILFGIVGKRGDDGQDYAERLEPLQHAEAFAAKVSSLIPEYLSPPNPNIEVRVVAPGLVAVHVGSSDLRPHMSMAPDHRKYFLRVQASNQPMVDFQIRDMLRVNTTPRLTLGYQLRPGAISGGDHESQLVLTLINAGRVSAYQPYIVVKEGTTVRVVGSASDQFEEFRLARHSKRGFQGTGRFAVHPGHEVPAVAFLAYVRSVEGNAYLRLSGTKTNYVLWRNCQPVNIRASIGAEHTAAREVAFEIAQDELEAMAERVMLRQTFYGVRQF